ncbi:hypothetical protein GCM10010433_53460 [Streptomyces pulveraceus]
MAAAGAEPLGQRRHGECGQAVLGDGRHRLLQHAFPGQVPVAPSRRRCHATPPLPMDPMTTLEHSISAEVLTGPRAHILNAVLTSRTAFKVLFRAPKARTDEGQAA